MLGFRRRTNSTRDELVAEIERLTQANRSRPSRKTERRILRERHRLGLRRLEEAPSEPQHPDPTGIELPAADELPEFTPAGLTPEVLRAAILRDGCALVRGLVAREDAVALAELIERAFHERGRTLENAKGVPPGYYEPFEGIDAVARNWVGEGGGLLVADAPMLAFELFELFAKSGLSRLVEGYLGEPPLISGEKTTLRRADPTVYGAWHQDGKFMGDVRALNLWLSLSRCGDVAPGLDLVPRRLNELVATGGSDAFHGDQVSDAAAHEAAVPKRVIRPIFEPGDALLFDELFLHATGADPSMPNPRFAVESWFFGGSAFPEYLPIAV